MEFKNKFRCNRMLLIKLFMDLCVFVYLYKLKLQIDKISCVIERRIWTCMYVYRRVHVCTFV